MIWEYQDILWLKSSPKKLMEFIYFVVYLSPNHIVTVCTKNIYTTSHHFALTLPTLYHFPPSWKNLHAVEFFLPTCRRTSYHTSPGLNPHFKPTLYYFLSIKNGSIFFFSSSGTHQSHHLLKMPCCKH